MAPKKTAAKDSKGESHEAVSQANAEERVVLEQSEGVTTERVLIEVVCFVGVTLLSAISVSIFSVSPFLPSWKRKDAVSNAQLLVGLVLAAYVAFRAYFGFSFALLAYAEKRVSWLAESPNRVSVGRGIITAVAVIGLAILYSVFPESKAAIYKLIVDALGDLPDVLESSMKGEIKRVQERLWKMAGLFAGWFLFFLCFELVLRVFLHIVRAIITAVVGGKKVVVVRKVARAEEEEEESSKQE
jgi:hypothetical protein